MRLKAQLLLVMLIFLSPLALANNQNFQIESFDSSQGVSIGSGSLIEARLNEGKFQARYRMQTEPSGEIRNNQVQLQLLFDVTVSFFKDRVRLDFEAQNGSRFDSGWANAGIGNDTPNFDFFLRRLSLTLSPKQGLDLTVGSMKPEYGAGSDNTTLNVNGYIMGYRARVALEHGTLVVTTGYVGDFDDPNVFGRMGRLDEFNFVQAMLTHAIGEIVSGSLDFTRLEGDNHIRGAFKFNVSQWTALLDSLTVEGMVNVSTPGSVLTAKLEKRFRELMNGRDLATAVTYIYKTEDGFAGFPLAGKVWDGHSVRVTFSIPNMIRFKDTQLGVFIDYIQSLTDLKRVRVESGLVMRF